MRLLVVSHTPHHRRGADVVGWGATVRELDRLAALCDTLVHLAPLHPGPAPAEARPYAAANVELVPVRPAGGDGALAKLSILAVVPSWVATLRRELRSADAVHVRTPANLALVALVVLALRRRPGRRWIKYAGEWGSRDGEPLSFRLQRRLLRARWFHRGTVTVNGPSEGGHVVEFVNPVFDEAERRAAVAAAHGRSLGTPIRLLFVGRLDGAKRGDVAAAVLPLLRARRIDVRLDVVGDGDLPAGEDPWLTLHGWLPRAGVDERYRDAHLLLVPSVTEGFPKVVAEAAAFGVVPIVSELPGVAGILTSAGFGTLVPRDASAAVLAAAVEAYAADPERWRRESEAAVVASERFTYEHHVEAVATVLGLGGGAGASG